MPIQDCARLIFDAFLQYDRDFREVTARAAGRFLRREWDGVRADVVERMELWERSLGLTTETLHERLGAKARNRDFWHRVKEFYGARIESFADAEFARTYITSVTRRVSARGCLLMVSTTAGPPLKSPPASRT